MKTTNLKITIARKVAKLSGKYRVRTIPGWGGPWVWEYRERKDTNGKAWQAVCPVECAGAHFGWDYI